jgi:aminotransferase
MDKLNSHMSELVDSIDQAMSIKYNTMVYEMKRRGKKVLVLSLGEAFFDIPFNSMSELPFPDLYHYSDSRGIPNLREKLSEFFLKKYDIPINYEKEILISSGSKAAIYLTFLSILNPEDEVIVQEPYWVSYPEQIRLCNGVPISIPYFEDVYRYEKYITSKTKAIVICNPHNPTGHLYSEREIKHLLMLAEKYNLWILSDEAYSEFVSNEDEFVSPAKIDREKKYTIVFNSISKNYGISGWRLGYVIGNEKLIYNILKLNQHIITCAPTILQHYVDKYFYEILEHTEPQIKLLLDKRKVLSDYMSQLELDYLSGSATFYFFISISPSYLSSEEFCTRLLHEHYISAVPGIGYGNSCDSFIRVSFGSEKIEDIKFALQKIKGLIVDSSKNPVHPINALVIGGGLWQVPIIKLLKSKGHRLHVVDPYKHSPGVKISDNHIQCDVRDTNSIIDSIKELSFKCVTSDQSDISVNTVSSINEYLNLNGPGIKSTGYFTNKYKMRTLSSNIGVPCPNFRKINSISDLNDFINDNGLPIILKPADSQSSRGVSKINSDNVEELEHIYINSLKYSNCGYLIAEDFIDGTEVTVEGFVSDNKYLTLAISEKKHFRTGIASELRYPADISSKVKNALRKYMEQFVTHSKLIYGITHAEFMVNKDTGDVTLIEIACRGGGTLISSNIVKLVSDFDVYEEFYNNLIGNVTKFDDITINEKHAILKFFEFSDGKVKDIHGIDFLSTIEEIEEIQLNFKIGDVLLPADDDRSRQGFYIASAPTKQELDRLIDLVDRTAQVDYE